MQNETVPGIHGFHVIPFQIMPVIKHGFRIDKHRSVSVGDEILVV